MKKYFIILMAFSCINIQSCSHSSNNGFEKTKAFYERAKNKNIDILFGLIIRPRSQTKDGFKVYKIQLNRKNDTPLTIPVFDSNMKEKELLDSTVFDIEEFAKLKAVEPDKAFEFTRDFSERVITLYQNLDVISIESYPDLGKFIIFKVHPEYEIIYVPDKTKVYHKYWKELFSSTQKFDNNWYYRKINTEGSN